MDEIRVLVVRYPDRKFLMMRYLDPATRKHVARSTRTTNKREAERAAAKWEAELREGRFKARSKVTWDDFRERYRTEHLASLAAGSADRAETTLDMIEAELHPDRASDVQAAEISRFQAALRARGLSEQTIKSYLATVKAALSWALRVEIVGAVPRIEMPKRAKGGKVMKGRPITLEEFERMLAKVPAVVGEAAAPSWRFYLRGLWLSGLRLRESLDLHWDTPNKLRVDLDSRRPMLVIPAELEKGNRDRVLPMAPEFAEFLAAVPQDQRVGPVFSPTGSKRPGRLAPTTAGPIITAIGKAAGVKVDEKPGKAPKGTKRAVPGIKYASAHDLRRAFGHRWASRVMPAILQQLMRHESIETTLRFYVGRNAESTADVLWEAHDRAGNTSGNSDPKSAPQSEPAKRR